jgi:hypothetical protein
MASTASSNIIHFLDDFLDSNISLLSDDMESFIL